MIFWRRFNLVRVVAYIVLTPIALYLGWLRSVEFVSLLSIWGARRVRSRLMALRRSDQRRNMNLPPYFGIGFLIALLVLVIDIVLWLTGHPIDREVVYGSACALALARLLP